MIFITEGQRTRPLPSMPPGDAIFIGCKGGANQCQVVKQPRGSASSDSLMLGCVNIMAASRNLTSLCLMPSDARGRKILEMVKVEREELLGGREKPAPHPNLHLRKRPVQNSICVPLRIYVPSVRTSCGNDSLDILGSSSNLCNH